MKVGLVHGRFQPFHNGHKFLVDKMLQYCDISVILIGSANKKDNKNIFSLNKRKYMINSIYKEGLIVGANLDLNSENNQWDVLLSSCVLSLTGYLPTHIFAGEEYNIIWQEFDPKIFKYKRYEEISASNIRQLIYSKDFLSIEDLVPTEVFRKIS